MINHIGKNIHAIRTRKGLNQKDLAKIARVRQTTVSNWETGTNTPRQTNAERILQKFSDLSFDDIYSDELGFAKQVLRSDDAKYFFSDVPLYGTISAGSPIEKIEIDDMIPIPAAVKARYPKAFLLRVRGNSMDRVLPDGSLALVLPTTEFVDGAIYAVSVDGADATVKRVHVEDDGTVELVPDSRDASLKPRRFANRHEGEQRVEAIGRVVWYYLPFDYEL